MTFQARLRHVMQAGNLTVADLARWFDRRDPTVRGWVMKGVAPGGAPLDIRDAETRLGQLEALVARRKGSPFPVPRLSPIERIAYMDRVRASV